MSENSTKKPSKMIDACWWGEYELELGKWSRWIIGPMDFMAKRTANEWRFCWKTNNEVLSERVEHFDGVETPAESENYEYRRFAVDLPGTSLKITPRLADRPVIVRPETPLFLPPRQHTKLYVSTSVWLVAEPVVESAPELMEVPMFRSSDTWFGPDTINGELCYASMTNARTDVQMLAPVLHRAFTPVEIFNKGKDALAIESLRVPVNMLSLYVGKRGRLWTDKITFERSDGEAAANLRITDHEELSSNSGTLLSGPRIAVSTGIVHAFSRMFGREEM